VKLYRSVVGTPYAGAGSFWSPDPTVAKKYGKRGGHVITTEARGRALRLSSDEELVKALVLAGIADAEDRVLGADWFSDDVYEALRRFDYTWIVRPVDPEESSKDIEWIYVGERPLRWKAA
jgi:hypothetical protein